MFWSLESISDILWGTEPTKQNQDDLLHVLLLLVIVIIVVVDSETVGEEH